MHVVITGANSFIGKAVVEVLSRAGLKVTGTYRSESKIIDDLRSGLNPPELVRLDLKNPKTIVQLPKVIDAVVHIAGSSNKEDILLDGFLHSNVDGTRNIQKYALSAGAKCLIFTSSISVHGSIKDQYVDEKTPIIDPDVYGASKYLGERLLSTTRNKLPVAAIRLPGVLGLGAIRAWIPTLLKQIVNQQDVTIINPQAKFNNAIHVYDLANFILTILFGNKLSGFHAFPLASSGTITIREVAEYLKEATKSSSNIIAKSSMQNSFIICSEYAVQNFDYKPKEISETLKHFLSDLQ